MIVRLLLLCLLLPSSSFAAELSVYAAASLSDSLAELAPLYTGTSGDTLRFNFGASGTLARQIQAGAPADVFFSADELRVDQLAKANLLLPGTRRTLLANTLVLIVPAGRHSPDSFAALSAPSVRHIAIGLPATVPAGTYARAYLEKNSLWDTLQPKLVFLDNVRAVLAAVESGDADAGIVYKTDALISRQTVVRVSVPAADGPAITYPAVVLQSSRSPEAARRFLAWLAGPQAGTVFKRHGFLPAP